MQLVNKDVEKEVYEELIGSYTRHAHRLSPQQFSELVTRYSEADLGVETKTRLKQKLLDKYSQREPKKFTQIDCWGPNSKGDCMTDPSGSGFGMTAVMTQELMSGSPVRILIGEDYTDPELLAEMLEKAAKVVRKGTCDNDFYCDSYYKVFDNDEPF